MLVLVILDQFLRPDPSILNQMDTKQLTASTPQAVVALWPFLLSALRVDLPDPCLAAISAVTDVAKAFATESELVRRLEALS